MLIAYYVYALKINQVSNFIPYFAIAMQENGAKQYYTFDRTLYFYLLTLTPYFYPE